ncbi:MAG: class I SAM-dependent methyltransferase [Dehalococcoidales bacterium]|nr:MAG: class I SAM-dependent methyltransferase [Dehalococcoidales bacterium]
MDEKELHDWFTSLKDELETAYVRNREPWRQSGYLGSEEQWIAARKPVADCIEKSGSFLDIGCANGYLLECILKWTSDRNLRIIPYGIDISGKLIELAKERLAGYADNLFTGNGWDWNPPTRFDYVRTELVYVPEHLQKRYLDRILNVYLKEDGKLLIAEYGLSSRPPNTSYVGNLLVAWDYDLIDQKSGYYESKEHTRIYIIAR